MLEKADIPVENTETIVISSIDDAIDEVLDPVKKPTDPPTLTKRKKHAGCEECDIPFNTKKELKVNLLFDEIALQCQLESCIFFSIYSFSQQHELRYHTPKKCGVCQVIFANNFELRNHARQDHEIEHCSNDEAEFSSSENDSNFRCDICGMTDGINSNDQLSRHVALHENQLKCVVCGTILKHRANLVLHMRIHVIIISILLLNLIF